MSIKDLEEEFKLKPIAIDKSMVGYRAQQRFVKKVKPTPDSKKFKRPNKWWRYAWKIQRKPMLL